MRLYFAYGSNLLRAQMGERCPAARAVGPARLEGWRFLINLRGVATISPDPQDVVHGIVWRLTEQCEAALDRYEGVTLGNYEKRFVRVAGSSGQAMEVMTYVDWRVEHGCPRPGYLDGRVLPGAREWALPPDYIARLEAWL